MEKEIILSRVSPDFAAGFLAGIESHDPSGRSTPADIASTANAGQCFAATTADGQAVYIIKVDNGVAFVTAMLGRGPLDWYATLLPIIEAQAKGCNSVGITTCRRGVVRKAEKLGYRVTGWTLKKELLCA